jgi:hypothetical protein
VFRRELDRQPFPLASRSDQLDVRYGDGAGVLAGQSIRINVNMNDMNASCRSTASGEIR